MVKNVFSSVFIQNNDIKMAKQIVERNQAFVEKVLNENEKLLLAYDNLKQELSEARYNLNNVRKETIKSMEPKIAELLEKHRNELENQKKSLNLAHSEEISRLKSDFEEQRLKNIAQNASLEEKYNYKLQKLKERALGREQEIKDAFNAKIAQLNSRIAQTKEIAHEEEEASRSAWQKMITDKIRKEFQEKAENDEKRQQNRQEKMLMDVVSKIEADAHEESVGLRAELEKERKDHRIAEQRLKKNTESLENQISSLKEGRDMEMRELRDKVLVLSEKVSKCKCKQYSLDIESLNNQLSYCREEIESYKKKLEEEKRRNNEKTNITISQLKEENERLNEEIKSYKEKMSNIEKKHQEELAIIAERVKKTVQTKDLRIQQLVDQFERLKGNYV